METALQIDITLTANTIHNESLRLIVQNKTEKRKLERNPKNNERRKDIAAFVHTNQGIRTFCVFDETGKPTTAEKRC